MKKNCHVIFYKFENLECKHDKNGVCMPCSDFFWPGPTDYSRNRWYCAVVQQIYIVLGEKQSSANKHESVMENI